MDWTGLDWTGLTQKSIKCLFQCRTEAKHTYSFTKVACIACFCVFLRVGRGQRSRAAKKMTCLAIRAGPSLLALLLFSFPLEHVCPFRAPRRVRCSAIRTVKDKRGAERGTERGTDAPRRVYTVRIAEHRTRRGARNGRTCSNGTENNSIAGEGRRGNSKSKQERYCK